MKKYGIFTRELRTYPLPDGGRSQPVWVLIDDKGRDVLPLIEKDPSPFYLAVLEDGAILSMWDDISHMQIPGVLIIGIDQDFGYTWGEGGSISGKFWNGKAIVEPEAPEPPLEKWKLETVLLEDRLDPEALPLSPREKALWRSAATLTQDDETATAVFKAAKLSKKAIALKWKRAREVT